MGVFRDGLRLRDWSGKAVFISGKSWSGQMGWGAVKVAGAFRRRLGASARVVYSDTTKLQYSSLEGEIWGFTHRPVVAGVSSDKSVTHVPDCMAPTEPIEKRTEAETPRQVYGKGAMHSNRAGRSPKGSEWLAAEAAVAAAVTVAVLAAVRVAVRGRCRRAQMGRSEAFPPRPPARRCTVPVPHRQKIPEACPSVAAASVATRFSFCRADRSLRSLWIGGAIPVNLAAFARPFASLVL